MFTILEKAVLGMAALRLFSGGVEMLAALLMIKFNSVEKALVVNSSLALIGPTVLILTTAIGISSLASEVSFSKLIWVLVGVGFIFYGVRSS